MKLRATVQISIGNLLSELLDFGTARIHNGDIQEGDDGVVSKQFFLFDEFEQNFPQVKLPTNL